VAAEVRPRGADGSTGAARGRAGRPSRLVADGGGWRRRGLRRGCAARRRTTVERPAGVLTHYRRSCRRSVSPPMARRDHLCADRRPVAPGGRVGRPDATAGAAPRLEAPPLPRRASSPADGSAAAWPTPAP